MIYEEYFHKTVIFAIFKYKSQIQSFYVTIIHSQQTTYKKTKTRVIYITKKDINCILKLRKRISRLKGTIVFKAGLT